MSQVFGRFASEDLRMTPKQANSLTPWIPKGYIAMVEDRLRLQNLPVPSQPFISNVKKGRKDHDAIEAILMDLVREERAKADAKQKTITALTT